MYLTIRGMAGALPAPSEPYSRSAGLTGLADLARSVGLDPVRLLQSAGAPRRALTDPDLKITGRVLARVLETAARRSDVIDFGLRLAEQRRLSNMGVLGLVVRDQPNLRRVIEIFAQYNWLQTEAVSVVLEEAGDHAIARLVFALGGGRASRQSTELCVGVLCRTLAALAGSRWRPQWVGFTHGPPGAPTCHRRVLGVEPAFEQDFDGVMFPRADLDAVIPAADPEMASQIAQFAELARRERPRRTSDRVRELVPLLLPARQATAERVASHLGFDRRTLSRRLTKEQTSFSAILDGVRLEIAQSYVGGSDRSLTAIAEALGFSELSAFSRWHVQRFGENPLAWRRRQAAWQNR